MKLLSRILHLFTLILCLNIQAIFAQTKVLSEEDLLLKEEDM
jgi:hypothetical protein